MAAREDLSSDASSNSVTILDPVPKKKASKTWAALIKKIFEVDPLICQKCGETMKIQGFITNQEKINQILHALKISPFQKPTPIKINSPPGTLVPDPEFEEYLRAVRIQ